MASYPQNYRPGARNPYAVPMVGANVAPFAGAPTATPVQRTVQAPAFNPQPVSVPAAPPPQALSAAESPRDYQYQTLEQQLAQLVGGGSTPPPSASPPPSSAQQLAMSPIGGNLIPGSTSGLQRAQELAAQRQSISGLTLQNQGAFPPPSSAPPPGAVQQPAPTRQPDVAAQRRAAVQRNAQRTAQQGQQLPSYMQPRQQEQQREFSDAENQQLNRSARNQDLQSRRQRQQTRRTGASPTANLSAADRQAAYGRALQKTG